MRSERKVSHCLKLRAFPSNLPPGYNRGMDERDETPIAGRSENELLVKAATGVIAATSPIWIPWAIFLYLDVAGDDGPTLLLAGCFSIGALAVWLFVRWINRWHDTRLWKRPPDPP